MSFSSRQQAKMLEHSGTWTRINLRYLRSRTKWTRIILRQWAKRCIQSAKELQYGPEETLVRVLIKTSGGAIITYIKVLFNSRLVHTLRDDRETALQQMTKQNLCTSLLVLRSELYHKLVLERILRFCPHQFPVNKYLFTSFYTAAIK